MTKPTIQNPKLIAQYFRNQVETASPTRLVVLLYDGAIRFCTLGLESMCAGDLEKQNTNLIKAQRILGELMGSLNREAGGEVGNNLMRLYLFMMEQLVTANLRDLPGPVTQVIRMLRDLRETWNAIDLMTTVNGGTEASSQAATKLSINGTKLPSAASNSAPVAKPQPTLPGGIPAVKPPRAMPVVPSVPAVSRLGDRHA